MEKYKSLFTEKELMYYTCPKCGKVSIKTEWERLPQKRHQEARLVCPACGQTSYLSDIYVSSY